MWSFTWFSDHVHVCACVRERGWGKKERERNRLNVSVCQFCLLYSICIHSFIHSFILPLLYMVQCNFFLLLLPLKHNQNQWSGSPQRYGCDDCQICTWRQIIVASNHTWVVLCCQGIPQGSPNPGLILGITRIESLGFYFDVPLPVPILVSVI